MVVAFYKGRERILNRLISWWTRGKYSHVELVLDNGISISSSFMDGGVRYKRIDYNPDNWDFIEVGPVTDDIKMMADSLIGMKYDLRGILGFVIRSVADDRKKMFCSEAVMHLLGYDEPWRFSPNTASIILGKVK